MADRAAVTEEAGPGAPRPRSGFSWRIGRLAGIDVYVHGTFVLLLAWIGASHLTRGQGVVEALAGVGMAVAMFTVVVLHELGHALAARRYGIGTRDITLLPIGGVARLERMPDDPKQELVVAVAGPLVNVALAALFFGMQIALDRAPGIEDVRVVGGPFFAKLMWINVSLALFNLLPAFPMDGGRVLRALLATRMSHVRATDWAASIGKALAVVLGVGGFFVSPMLVFIALFVWVGAQGEMQHEHVRSSLEGLRVGDAMLTHFRVLSPSETVAHAAEHVASGFQKDFPVVLEGTCVGVLRREDLMRALALGQSRHPVGELMKRELAIADPDTELVEALGALGEAEGHAIFVVRGGVLLGMITPERVGEIMMIRETAGRRR